MRVVEGLADGDVIGTTGNTGSSTGSHLHIECLYQGEYYNPLFYFEAGTDTLYGETPGSGSGGGNVIPPDSYDDATVQALMEEAARYLGYPYGATCSQLKRLGTCPMIGGEKKDR